MMILAGRIICGMAVGLMSAPAQVDWIRFLALIKLENSYLRGDSFADSAR